MAQAKFIEGDAFSLLIERAAANTEKIAGAALRAGASIIADEMKRNLQNVLSPAATGELVGAFGITPVKQDRYMDWNVHLGFDGYQMPGRVPFQLLARTFESGAVMGGRYTGKTKRGKRETRKAKFGPEDYWRKPSPFAKPAVQSTRTQVIAAMKRAAERELEKMAEQI